VQYQTPPTAVSTPVRRAAPAVHVDNSENLIVQAIAQATPGLVKIDTVQHVSNFNPFLGQSTQERPGLGSGFLFEYNGRALVLTNDHVVHNADEISVLLHDGTPVDAALLASSQAYDLAILEPSDLPDTAVLLPLGDSDATEVGSWVVALGSPFGMTNTATAGIVSAKEMRNGRYMIQTDAPINPGNSGGPLIDLGGNVIGINNAIYSPTNTNLGIGLAIPINQAVETVGYLIEGLPWIGVGVIENNPQLAQQFRLPIAEGLVIGEVMTQPTPSPAAQAGLQQGDILLEVDGAAVSSRDQLREAVLDAGIGGTLTLRLRRGAEESEVEVTAAKAPPGL
jgi:serine protease Do